MESEGSVCRVCLQNCDCNTSVFENLQGESYSSLLHRLSGCHISADDALPSALCSRCARLLRSLHRLAVQCRRSDRKLRRAFRRGLPFVDLRSSNSTSSSPSGSESNIKSEQCDDYAETSIEQENSFSFESAKVDVEHDNPQFRTMKIVKHGVELTVLKCLLCGVSVRNRSALVIHHRKHTGERPYKCPYCDKCFTQGGTLSEHVRRKHSESKNSHKSFTCDVCGKLFMRKNDLNMHMRIHTKEKPYECPHCPQRFSQRGTLKQHRMLHTGERPFSCKVCGKKFIARTTLRRHMSVHSDERNFKCNLCEKALKSSFALKKHMVFIHTSEKPNVCRECGARFAAASNLKAHTRSKHSELSGNCDICKKHFSILSDHMRIHTGDTPFQCHLCSKRFAQKRSLTAHINKHENATKFACTAEGCGSAFSMQCKLDFHILKVHSNFTPHVCQYCSKGFYRSSDLTKHINSTHYKEKTGPISI